MLVVRKAKEAVASLKNTQQEADETEKNNGMIERTWKKHFRLINKCNNFRVNYPFQNKHGRNLGATVSGSSGQYKQKYPTKLGCTCKARVVVSCDEKIYKPITK